MACELQASSVSAAPRPPPSVLLSLRYLTLVLLASGSRALASRAALLPLCPWALCLCPLSLLPSALLQTLLSHPAGPQSFLPLLSVCLSRFHQHRFPGDGEAPGARRGPGGLRGGPSVPSGRPRPAAGLVSGGSVCWAFRRCETRVLFLSPQLRVEPLSSSPASGN